MSQSNKIVKAAFETEILAIALDNILPTRNLEHGRLRTKKYVQIESALDAVGLVEPLVVARQRGMGEKVILLDGHLRLVALRRLGAKHADCLIATDDEGYTYNKHVNRLSTIQEHNMIRRAIDRGLSEETIAEALNLHPSVVRKKSKLLDGIDEEVAERLKDKRVPAAAFPLLKRASPTRQREIADLMAATDTYTMPYVSALVAASPQRDLVTKRPSKIFRAIGKGNTRKMQRELAAIEKRFTAVQDDLGSTLLDYASTHRYIAQLLENMAVVQYLARHHSWVLRSLQDFVDAEPPSI
jgi:hypothetical protein